MGDHNSVHDAADSRAQRTVHLLLVEDDDIDAEAVRRALRKQKIGNPLHRVTNGIEALEVLRGEAGREKLPRPYLILLDLNMPRMNGLEFLREVRRDAALRPSIVFVLTTSDAERDKLAAYAENVAGYMVKSRVGDEFAHLLSLLDGFWRIVEFPPAEVTCLK